ncbi:hypothetical protein BGW80DRAFT_1456484 [Lactifluus volemus]|nr:hypothetical protein BGW80DRAFT_1456484 [Lactifluus volemus]
MPTLPTPVGMRELHLEGARLTFVQERTLFVVLVDDTIIPFEFVIDGKMVLRLVMGAALAQTASPAIVQKAHDNPSASGPAAVIDAVNAMDLNDDDDIYGTSSPDPLPSTSTVPSAKMRTVIHLSLCDSLPANGPIFDLTFVLVKNGDRFVPERVTETCRGSSEVLGSCLPRCMTCLSAEARLVLAVLY